MLFCFFLNFYIFSIYRENIKESTPKIESKSGTVQEVTDSYFSLEKLLFHEDVISKSHVAIQMTLSDKWL